MKILLISFIMSANLLSSDIVVSKTLRDSIRVTNYTENIYTIFYNSQEIDVKVDSSLLVSCKRKEFVYIVVLKKDENAKELLSTHISCATNVKITDN